MAFFGLLFTFSMIKATPLLSEMTDTSSLQKDETEADTIDSDKESEVTPSPLPQFHIVMNGDTLWDIAGTYLHQPERWTGIWKLNKSTIKNPHWIYPDQKIFLSASQPTIQSEPVSETRPMETAQAEETQLPLESSQVSPAIKEDEKFSSSTESLPQARQSLNEVGQIVWLPKKMKRNGIVSKENTEKLLMEPGDIIIVKFRKRHSMPVGTIFTVFRHSQPLIDAQGDFIPEGDDSILLETIGAVELTENLTPAKSMAKIITVSAPLSVGDSIRIREKDRE